MLTPTKMEMCKITAYAQKKREIIRALHRFGQIEIYDMEKKARTQRGQDERKKITEYISRINQLMDVMQPKITNPKPKIIDEDDLKTIFAECDNFLSGIEPELTEIRQGMVECAQKLSDLEVQKETVLGLVELDFDVSLLGSGKDFFSTAGQIPSERVERFKFNLKGLAHGKSLLLVSSRSRKRMSVIVVGVPNQFKEALEHVLRALGFLEFQVSEKLQGKKSQEILAEIEQQISEYKERKAALEKKSVALAKDNANMLFALREQFDIELERSEVAESLWEDESTIEIWGWVPVTKKRATIKLIEKTDSTAQVEFVKPPLPTQEYPTKLENPKFARSYERLVHSFGTPVYGKDWDPTILMFITIPIIFGIMFADVGHGFLLTLIGILGLRLKEIEKPDGMLDMIKEYLQKGGPIITYCGIASMIFGVLFGSIFGLHGHNNPLLVDLAGGHAVKAAEAASYYWFGIIPVWFVPAVGEVSAEFGNVGGIFLLLELALLIGIIQISSGFVLQVIMEIRHKKLGEAILGPGAFLVMYLSAALLLFTYGANFLSWFGTTPRRFTIALLPFTWDPNLPGLEISGFFVFLLGILVPFVLTAVHHVRHGMDGISHLIDTAVSLIGNTVSYARIFAINIVHAILSELPFLIIASLWITGGAIIPIVGHEYGLFGFLFGIAIILTLELMITFLQCLRLHWVEWFGKMQFKGGGYIFNPFKEKRKFTAVQPGKI
ncbi:MAG: V-type ATP synthase subunit I [Candidatus Hermodarchaeota archaeon]